MLGGFMNITQFALEAMQKERDALAAYADTLEKAGDAMRRSTWVDFRTASFSWDVARQTKPEV